MALSVNAVVVAAPDKLLGAEDFQRCLIESKTRFAFKTKDAFKQFLADRAKDFADARAKFEDPQYETLFAPLTGLPVLADHHDKGQLRTEITVQTTLGVVKVDAFLSLKRHALISFQSNFTTPRDAKKMNSIVRDADVLAQCFALRVQRLAERIADQGYVFGVDARADDKLVLLGEMNIASDSLPLTQIPSRGLQLHLFPDQGPAVRQIPDHAKYAAMVTFLLWYYRSDENVGVTQKLDQVERTERKLGTDNPQYKDLVRSLDKMAADVKERAGKLVDAKVDFDKKHTSADVLPRHLHGPAGSGCKLLYELLRRHGMISLLPSGTSVAASAKPLGGSGELKAPVVDPTHTVVFKTHKIEVQSKLKDMPWDIIAWLLDGKLVMDTTHGKPTVQLMLEGWKIDKSKYATVATDDPDTALRKKAHLVSRKDAIDEMVEWYVLPSTALHDKINRFCELYKIALGSGIARLQSVKA